MKPMGVVAVYGRPTTGRNQPSFAAGRASSRRAMFTGSGSSRTPILPAGIGTLPRSSVRAPGDVDLDVGIARRFQIKDRANLQIRAEAFNLLNHTNFLSPNTTLSVTANAAGQPIWNSPNFGLITSARSARFLQLSARFEF